MSDNSRIEWTDATWNPTTGCTKVSPGCDHCYAEGVFNRFNGVGAFDTVQLRPERLGQPLRWRKPRRVFVNSMSDLFHEDVPDVYIAQVFAVMATAYQHTFQILTKRHGRMRSLLNSDRFVELFDREYCAIPDWADRWPDPDYSPGNDHLSGGPLRNVWLGVSVEDQKWAEVRIPALIATPAAVRFLSCEPLLGPMTLSWLYRVAGTASQVFPLSHVAHGIQWVIVGGESGAGARAMAGEWPRTLRDECTEAGVAFFFKQWGAHDEAGNRVGRHAAGRLLDGRTWDEYPVALTTVSA